MSQADYQALLLSALVDLETLKPSIEAGLGSEHFCQYQDEWRFVESHSRLHGRVPNRQMMKTRFPKLFLPEGQGQDVQGLVDLVRDQYLYDQTSLLMKEALQILTRGDAKEALKVLQSEARHLTSQIGMVGKDIDLTRDWSYFLDDALRRRSAHLSGELQGVATGLTVLDNHGGLEDGDLVTCMARSGHGKSWMLQYMAAHSLLQGKKVVFVPLEMSSTQVGYRFHVILQSLFRSRQPEDFKRLPEFRNSALTQGHSYDVKGYRNFLELVSKEVEGSLQIADRPGKFTPLQVLQKLEAHQPDVVFVDYLTLMSGGSQKKDQENWLEIKALTNELKGIALDYNVPIVVAAQANRVGISRKGPPELSDIAYGDAIGQDSSVVVSLKQCSSDVSWCRLVKNRSGTMNQDFWLNHDFNRGRYGEVSQERAMDMLHQTEDEEGEVPL